MFLPFQLTEEKRRQDVKPTDLLARHMESDTSGDIDSFVELLSPPWGDEPEHPERQSIEDARGKGQEHRGPSLCPGGNRKEGRPDGAEDCRSHQDGGAGSGALGRRPRRHEGDFSLLATAIGLGASLVRVGFEESILWAPRKAVKRNAELVEKLARLVRLLGHEVGTPGEARRILGIR